MYLNSEILDDIISFATAKGDCISKSREKDLKFIFFRIWLLNFSFYFGYGFLIAKGRTLKSQNSARISIDLESVSDCVNNDIYSYKNLKLVDRPFML